VQARDDHGKGIPNGNKTSTRKWEWEGVGMNVDENGNDPYSHGKKFTQNIFYSGLKFLHHSNKYSIITDRTF